MSGHVRSESLLALISCLGAIACAPPVAATPYPTTEPAEGTAAASSDELAPSVVRFLDREVDLKPFLEGFPYTHFTPAIEDGTLFFIETGDRYVLRSLPLPSGGVQGEAAVATAPLDLGSASAVTEVDWSTRSLWDVRVHAPSQTLWLHADARNDEQMNLWRLALDQPTSEREPEQLTFADYVYGFGFSEDRAQVAYLARTGAKAPYQTCLHLLNAAEPKADQADQRVVCDSPELSFTWGTPHFSPEGDRVYFNAQVEGDRKRVQIVEVDLRRERPVAKPITKVGVPRHSPGVLDGWVDGERLLFSADDEGFTNLYSWHRHSRKTKRLTDLDRAMLGAEALEVDGKPAVFIASGTPAGSSVTLLDARTGESLGEADVPGKVSILDAHGARAVWSQEAPNMVYEANLATFTPKPDGLDLRSESLIALPPSLESGLVRCEPEAVKIPTFDDRELHAFVLRPKQPADQAIAMVRSFYGGDNVWTRYDHILCAAGITVVSAAVRGSSGFGAEFGSLNDRDLGGDEIVDLFWVARWITAQLEIPEARIGVYGRSHGGFATMRAMTFPPQTNGRDESYRFAFGLAEAGFSDIVAFHDATNIPDWVVLEAGDPAIPEDLAKLQDRSPLNHVDRLEAPIFLLHGGNDWRVPVAGSRAFVEAAQAAGKVVTYHEVEGQGHHIEGQERIVEAWQARFDFIAGVLGEGQAEPVPASESSATVPAPGG